MRYYELAYIADSDLDEKALAALQEKIENWITAEGGTILKIDRWGRRRLAYQINKKNDGVYVFIKTQMPASAGQVLEQNLRITEDVMRFMLILEEAEIPVEEAEIPVEKAEIPVEEAEIPVEEAEIPVEEAEIPVDEAEIPVEEAEIPVDEAEAE